MKQLSNTSILLAVICVSVLIGLSNCQGHAENGNFGAAGQGTHVWEPTVSFIRQNLRLVHGYITLLRSIFIGSYDRPLVTSTDAPTATLPRRPSLVNRIPAAPRY